MSAGSRKVSRCAARFLLCRDSVFSAMRPEPHGRPDSRRCSTGAEAKSRFCRDVRCSLIAGCLATPLCRLSGRIDPLKEFRRLACPKNIFEVWVIVIKVPV
jgi:hypothetical protein